MKGRICRKCKKRGPVHRGLCETCKATAKFHAMEEARQELRGKLIAANWLPSGCFVPFIRMTRTNA